MAMIIYKGCRGWTAETTLALDDSRYLQILTMKRHSGALVTTVNAAVKEGSFFTYSPLDDFRATLASVVTRCTEKAVTAQHEEALAGIDDVKASALAFYAARA
jgi:hypothetical protein